MLTRRDFFRGAAAAAVGLSVARGESEPKRHDGFALALAEPTEEPDFDAAYYDGPGQLTFFFSPDLLVPRECLRRAIVRFPDAKEIRLKLYGEPIRYHRYVLTDRGWRARAIGG